MFNLPPLSLPVIQGKTYENESPYLMFYNVIMFLGWCAILHPSSQIALILT